MHEVLLRISFQRSADNFSSLISSFYSPRTPFSGTSKKALSSIMSLELHLQTFDYHDAQYKRALPKKEVACVLRSCGRIATVKEMEALLKPYGDVITRSEFSELAAKLPAGPKESELLTALQAFDHKELGTLTKVEVNSIFCQMTEKISTAELDAVLGDLEYSADGRVSIDVIAKKLLAPVKTLKIRPQDVSARINAI